MASETRQLDDTKDFKGACMKGIRTHFWTLAYFIFDLALFGGIPLIGLVLVNRFESSMAQWIFDGLKLLFGIPYLVAFFGSGYVGRRAALAKVDAGMSFINAEKYAIRETFLHLSYLPVVGRLFKSHTETQDK